MYEHLGKMKLSVQNNMRTGNSPKALSDIRKFAWEAYEFNQFYTDPVIENALTIIEKDVQIPDNLSEVHDRNVLFYDGFWSVDTRGLALIYLEALFDLGYNVYYVINAMAKGRKPVTEELIKKNNGKIIYITENLADNISMYKAICKAFEYVEPGYAFLYIYPNDVPVVMAFNHYQDRGITRYQINLTDHAYWLGVNAFDYCLEFRDYGAGISHYKRGIPEDKILLCPYYPRVDKDVAFAGYPFERDEGDFVVFSGGQVYKTIDKGKTYYKLVAAILKEHPRVKFWYAGNALCDDMKQLMADYPQRCYFTGERQDLFALLQNVDMYLSTFPLPGGLMSQYAAVAGKVPYTLGKRDSDSSGLLLHEDELGVLYSDANELLHEIKKYIEDEQYRNYKNSKMKQAVISKKDFTANLQGIMTSGRSSFSFKLKDYDVSDFSRIYRDRYAE